jgi:hypothetical protein
VIGKPSPLRKAWGEQARPGWAKTKQGLFQFYFWDSELIEINQNIFLLHNRGVLIVSL